MWSSFLFIFNVLNNEQILLFLQLLFFRVFGLKHEKKPQAAAFSFQPGL